MKLFQKALSALLAVALVLQCAGITALADAPTTRTEYSDDGVVYTYNADGTVTATIYTTPKSVLFQDFEAGIFYSITISFPATAHLIR